MAKKEKNFEEYLKNLEILVKELENGDVNLDDAIEKYKEAMSISKICNEKLNNAVEAINKVVKENGDVVEFKGIEEGE